MVTFPIFYVITNNILHERSLKLSGEGEKFKLFHYSNLRQNVMEKIINTKYGNQAAIPY